MNYKKFKLLFISLLVITLTFTSCKNDETTNDTVNLTTESLAAKNAMQDLNTHFNADGTLNPSENAIGNIIFDFCFDFVYPITLSYNNDTEVTVNDFEGLIEVLTNMTDNLYIDGIAFPFQVETFNDGNIEIQTITNEVEFMTLLESCGIDDDNDGCNCPEQYEPVCVEINDVNGETFTMEFPNMCYATCEGFTQEDIVTCDDSNPNNGDLFDDCFEFVYPITIVGQDGNEIVINNEEEFEIAIYTNYNFDFVYPFDVTVETNGQTETLTINDAEAFVNLLITCNGGQGNDCEDACPQDYNPVCVVTADGEIVEFQNACYALCEDYTPNDFVNCEDDNDCQDACTQIYEPVCIATPNGEIIEFQNACYALCEGFTQNDFVNCEDDNDNECTLSNLTVQVLDCINQDSYFIQVDFDAPNYNGYFTISSFQNELISGIYNENDFPVNLTVTNSGFDVDNLIVCLFETNENECCEDISWSVPDCTTNTETCTITNVNYELECDPSNNQLELTFNFEVENPGNESFDLFDDNNNLIGNYSLNELPLTIPINGFAGDQSHIRFCINDNPDCCEYIGFIIPDCALANNCWEFVYPVTIECAGVQTIIQNRDQFDNEFNPASCTLQYPFNVVIEGQGVMTINTPNNFWEIGELENMCD